MQNAQQKLQKRVLPEELLFFSEEIILRSREDGERTTL